MPYQLWRSGKLELYQRIQSEPRFGRATAIASFVATPLDETLFVGVYLVKGITTVPPGTIDPSTEGDAGGLNLYDLEPAAALAELRGRLIIEWGEGYRAWIQNAANQDKTIVELRRTVSDPPFPGFMKFSARLSALAAVPRSWREALSSVAGIYLLADPKSGGSNTSVPRAVERGCGDDGKTTLHQATAGTSGCRIFLRLIIRSPSWKWRLLPRLQRNS